MRREEVGGGGVGIGCEGGMIFEAGDGGDDAEDGFLGVVSIFLGLEDLGALEPVKEVVGREGTLGAFGILQTGQFLGGRGGGCGGRGHGGVIPLILRLGVRRR